MSQPRSRPTHLVAMPSEVTTPVVVSSPHSGRIYDWDFITSSVLDPERIRSSEDAFVDLLLRAVPDLGAPLMTAQMPRAFLDLNRAPEELDPAVVTGVPRGVTNPRITSGLGVIPRVVAQGRAIYSGKISRAEARQRIDEVWHPYHDALRGLLDAAHLRFGQAVLLDVHSMPHEAIEGTGPRGQTPEIVLGDRFGGSAAGWMVDAVEEVFSDLGFRVARNAPFAGAYMTQAYGRPDRGRHAIQIEIDRALYLDEARIVPGEGFDGLCALMGEAMARIFARLGPAARKVAAE